MPIGYKVAHGGKLVVKVWTKQVSKTEMLANSQESLSNPAVLPGRVEFVDLTRATAPHINEMELAQLIEGYRSHAAKMVNTNIAIVATGEQFDQARIYERLTTPHMVTVVVFNGVDTACTWLGLDEAEIRELVRDVLEEMSNS
jgi:hypothetical protein